MESCAIWKHIGVHIYISAYICPKYVNARTHTYAYLGNCCKHTHIHTHTQAEADAEAEAEPEPEPEPDAT